MKSRHPPLLDAVLRGLDAVPDQGLCRVARAAGVSRSWIAKLRAGQIRDPGVRRLQAVHDVLYSDAAAA